MNDEGKSFNPFIIYNLIYAAIVILIGLYALLFTDFLSRDYRSEIREFSEGWQDTSGKIGNINDIVLEDFSGHVLLEKEIPSSVTGRDSLCFESEDCNLQVNIGDNTLYRFDTLKNLTGMGYGRAYHEVGLSEDMAGKKVVLKLTEVSGQISGAGVRDVYLCPFSDYLHLKMDVSQVSFVMTLMIMFFGGLLVLVWAGVSDKQSLPLDILDLGVGSVLIGTWLLTNTGIMQLLTGRLYVWHVLNRMTIILVLYPFVRFFNSTTRQKRKIYNYIAFYITIAMEIIMVLMRIAMGIDTSRTYTAFEILMADSLFIILALMLSDDYFFCKKYGLPIEQKGIYLGLLLVFVCCILEYCNYRYRVGILAVGTFIRLGMLLFMIIVLIRFINWWMSDQAAVDRDRFVNRSLQFAVASKKPQESIRLLLEYMGEELGARRTIIFEQMPDGNFRSTYEWFMEGYDQLPKEITTVPYKGFLDKIYENMRSDNLYIEVSDKEEIKTSYPNLYDRLVKSGTARMVAGPMMLEERLIGILLISDFPPENFRNIKEIMGIISYFFAQFINQRNEQERILFYTYHDPTSGAGNRSALKDFTEGKLDMSQAFGYVLCEVPRLREINDTMGHDAGDEIVSSVGRILMDTFGKENVYRPSGEEFVAFGFESDETFFENDVERVRRSLADKDYTTVLGAVYCANGTTDLKNVRRYVREHAGDTHKG